MLKNYLVISFRNLLRSKVFSFINVAGLAIGLMCTLLIGAYVLNELSYDQYATNHNNIYRVGLQIVQNGGIDDYPNVDAAVAVGMKNAFPEIETSTRVTAGYRDYVKYKEAQFREDNIAFADSNFLKVFSLPLVEGNEEKALTEPNSIVVTKAFSKKYFGDTSPLGEMLVFTRGGTFKVTGVIDQVPENTHFHYDAFISMTSNRWSTEARTWSNIGYYSYLLLNPHADPKALEAKFPMLIEKYVLPEAQKDMGMNSVEAKGILNTWKFYLMPLNDIHLHSATKYEMEANGDIKYVYIFTVLAIFILLLACINFTNLSTASSAKRAREVGVRKALGSLRKQLINQFLIESIMLSFAAMTFALLLVIASLPFFNELTGKQISADFFLNLPALAILACLAIILGILAGLYPAFFLSSFETIRVLKGNSANLPGKRINLRTALVVFQFAISTGLIIATIIVYQQLHYMQTLKLGYEKEQILVIENAGNLLTQEDAYKQKIMQNHKVLSATISNDTPIPKNAGSINGTEAYAKENKESNIHISIFAIDFDYIETLGMKIITGRDFSKNINEDSAKAIINETAMRDFGWTKDNVIGKTLVRSGQHEYTIVGVVADFHYTSAKQKIAPLMMLRRERGGSLILRADVGDTGGLIKDLKKQWDSFGAGMPMDYYFLDDRFGSLYKAEQTTQRLFIVFVVIAMIIACLGLYGLSAYAAEQRIKEIGIRKVLGSTVSQILFLLSKDFLHPVMIAIVIAAPITYFAMSKWLLNFSYRTGINLWIFVGAGTVAVAIALITVSFQAVRAATNNPVKSLRAE